MAGTEGVGDTGGQALIADHEHTSTSPKGDRLERQTVLLSSLCSPQLSLASFQYN